MDPQSLDWKDGYKRDRIEDFDLGLNPESRPVQAHG